MNLPVRSPVILAAATFALLACAGPAVAQCADRTAEQRGAEIAKIEQGYEKLIRQVEAVPPDTAAYLNAEYTAALRDHNEARFNLMMQNGFYRPHQVAIHYKVLRDNLVAARTATSLGDQAVYLSVVLSRQSELADVYRDYLRFDGARSPRVVTSKDPYGDATWAFTVGKGMTLSALQCAVRLMREP